MSSSPSPPFPGRGTQYLRASVVDAAMTLGPKVTNLIFADSILEHPEEYSGTRLSKRYIPELSSPSAFSQDTASDFSSDAIGTPRSEKHSSSDLEFKGNPLKDYYLESPFVLISKTEKYSESPDTDNLPFGRSPKKGIKDFIFPSRKRPKESSPESKQSLDPNTFPALDAPVAPTLISTRNTPIPLPRSEPGNAAQSPSSKLRKRMRRVNSDDWDFKDPDRPSFFFEQALDGPVRVKSGRKSEDEDYGYVSEGTGLSSRGRSRRKGKSNNPRSGKNGKTANDRSLSNTRQNSSSEAVPQLPIAERFTRKLPPPSLKPIKSAPTAINANISLSDTSLAIKSSYQANAYSPMSDTSFAILPDLNVVKRLGLDKYAAGLNPNGVVGVNNEHKLQMMDKLLRSNDASSSNNPPPPHPPKVPVINVIPPTNQTDAVVSPITDPVSTPIRGRVSPFPTSPVRGREPAFPTKPILRHPLNSHRLTAVPLRFKLSPERYKDIDLPRSVRSSFEKDLEREEETERTDVDSASVYSG